MRGNQDGGADDDTRGKKPRYATSERPPAVQGLPKKEPPSLLYSLEELTKKAQESQPPPPEHDRPPDSSSIDLRALSAKQSERPAAVPAIFDAPALPAPPAPETGPAAPQARKSGVYLAIGLAIAVGGIAAAFVLVSQTKTEPSPALSATAPPASLAAPPPSAEAPVVPSVSAEPVASASAAQPTPARPRQPGPLPKPAKSTVPTAEPEPPAAEPPPTVAKPPPNRCGCAPTDLKCNMECSVKGP